MSAIATPAVVDAMGLELQRQVNKRLNAIDDTDFGPIGRKVAADKIIAEMVGPEWRFAVLERIGRTPTIVITGYDAI